MSDVSESSGQFLARIGTDAEKWASEFLARFAGQYNIRESAPGTGFGLLADSSPGSDMHHTVQGWFANAIGAGQADGYSANLFGSDRPEIVVLCGSTRFIDTFAKVNFDLTLHGLIVLSIGCVTSSDSDLGIDDETKRRLDELHKRKIDLADRVIVLNVGGYIGDSTRSEIAYAAAHGKLIEYLEAIDTNADLVPVAVADIDAVGVYEVDAADAEAPA